MRVGNNQHYNGNGLVIVGNNNSVHGNNNSVTGNNNSIKGNNNRGCGNNNSISGNDNKWTGNNNTTKGNGNSVVGNGNQSNGQGSKNSGGGITIAGANYGVKNITMKNGRIWIDGVESVGGGDDDGVVHNIFTPSGFIASVGSGGGSQLNTGTLNGGMFMSNVKGPVTKKKPKGTRPDDKKKRERTEPEPEPLFTEVPTEADAEADVIEFVKAKSAAKAARVEGEPKKDVPKCVVCLNGAPKCIILPCAHQCVCSTCARKLGEDGKALRGTAKCPICVAGVDAIKKPFLV